MKKESKKKVDSFGRLCQKRGLLNTIIKNGAFFFPPKKNEKKGEKNTKIFF